MLCGSVYFESFPTPDGGVTLDGYILGSAIVSDHAFLFLGFEAHDGARYIGKFRLGPLDADSSSYPIALRQQSNDLIEGVTFQTDPPVLADNFAPKVIAQAMPHLLDHIIKGTFMAMKFTPIPGSNDRQQSDMNKQVQISYAFEEFVWDATTNGLAQTPDSVSKKVQYIIDNSDIQPADDQGVKEYPEIYAIDMRYTDQLYQYLQQAE